MSRTKPPLPLASVERTTALARAGLDKADWYSIATSEITRICVAERWNPITFTEQLSILSPRVSIRRNVRLALSYKGEGEFLGNVLPGVRRSMEIYNASGVIGGNKVPYFSRALLGDNDSITLDTWMAYALLVVPDPTVTMFRRKATHKAANALVTKVAVRLGLTPRDCQAAIWCGRFRESGREPGYFPVYEEYERWLAYDRKFPRTGSIGVPNDDKRADPAEDAVFAENASSFDFGANSF